MIERDLAPTLRTLAGLYPVVTVTGPRQSGKTTLCRAVFPDLPYVSLEPMDRRESAQKDPRGFLEEFRSGAILDEVHHVPDLFGYLQEEVDERPQPGRFILTGSHHFGLSRAISQSLAGRTGVLHLLPPSLGELRRFPSPPTDLLTTLWTGAYPRIHDRGIPAGTWLADYETTYLERDVRQLKGVGDLEAFRGFVKLCAGRAGRRLNLADLGADAGVSRVTARSWISILETLFICFRIPGWHRNVRKQVVKAPNLHFFDSGLVCHLLGIREPEQLRHHPLRGAIFESWVAAEIYKARAHRGRRAALFHFRDSRGKEVDLIVDGEKTLTLVEAKSGATVASDFFDGLKSVSKTFSAFDDPRPLRARVIYGGDTRQRRAGTVVVPWSEIDEEDW